MFGIAVTAGSRRPMAGYERLGPDAWVTLAGPVVEAAYQARIGSSRHRIRAPAQRGGFA